MTFFCLLYPGWGTSFFLSPFTEKTIKELLDIGFILPNSSHFSSFVVLINKKDDSLRMCIDYKVLYINTIKNRYPIPRVHELIYEIHGAMYFSKIDLIFGYH